MRNYCGINGLTQNVNVKGGAVLHDGVARIVTTLGSAAQLHALGQDIDNLALALVTPLRSEYNCRHLGAGFAALVWFLLESPFC